ncbi:MAG: hypothetical protein ACLFPL_02165 [Candidatus Nanoarchaeia archaeon]
MTIFNSKKFSEDDERIIGLITNYLNDDITFDNEEGFKLFDFEEWSSIIVYKGTFFEFSHKLKTTFSFDIKTNDKSLICKNFHRLSSYKKMGYGALSRNSKRISMP